MYEKPDIRTLPASQLVESLGPAVALGSGLQPDELGHAANGGLPGMDITTTE